MCESASASAVAVFTGAGVRGEAVASAIRGGCRLRVVFTYLPSGEHGFHIHKAGDLRGEGCKGACEHYHIGPAANHGPAPSHHNQERHTGDLGNIALGPAGRPFRHTYFLKDVQPADLFGRSLIVHADPDDLGHGPHEDSKTTGHSGARIACAIFGRGSAPAKNHTRRTKRH